MISMPGERAGLDGRSESLSIAVAQPECVALDPTANAATHADVVHRSGARVVVFPEMSMTGYELHAPAVGRHSALWGPLVQACAATGSVALVGAPIAEAGHEYIATLAVSGRGVEVAYRKTWPGAEESVRFSPGPGPVVLQVDGWRIGLGICRDTGIAEHTTTTAALGMDVFAAGLADVPADLPMQRQRAERIARAANVPVAFASFAGATGRGYEQTAGGSAIYDRDGEVLNGCGPAAGAVARATIS